MADDKYRLYVLCPSCGGTGVLNWGDSPSEGGTHECPRCKDAEGDLAPIVRNGLRHVYAGALEKED